jgi:hypothetical protein
LKGEFFLSDESKLQTHSERVFWKICVEQGYRIEKLPTREKLGMRTADFRVSKDESTIIVEVEEIQPNQDDLRQIREMKENHFTASGWTIGSRARKHIRDAADQLKAHSNDKLPLVVILYNNICRSSPGLMWPMSNLESNDIDAAMYGEMVVHVALKSGAISRPDRSGGKRTLTATEKTYISAVAVILDYDDKTIIFYHNWFAAIPLPKTFFVGSNFFHLEKPGEPFALPSQWKRRE